MISIARSQDRIVPGSHARHALMIVVLLTATATAAVSADTRLTSASATSAVAASAEENSPVVESSSRSVGVDAQASTAARATIRWYLASPLNYEDGAWVLRGYVRNDETLSFSSVRMRITFADGSMVERNIVESLRPGDKIRFDFRQARPTEAPPQTVLLFTMAR